MRCSKKILARGLKYKRHAKDICYGYYSCLTVSMMMMVVMMKKMMMITTPP